MYTLDARMLGPLEIRVDGEVKRIPGNNARKVLAILLDDANRFVPVDGLTQGVWDGDPPADPVRQIRNRVSELRAALGPAKTRIELAESRDAYLFRIAETELDITRVKAAERRAAALRSTGSLHDAAAALRTALDEFRGPALAGMSGRLIGAIARARDEMRPPLLEQRYDTELDLGQHANLVDELRHTFRAHQHRQRFAAQYMRALHACGRAVEALEFYESVKRHLADTLGSDPDPDLRAIHLRILQDDTEPTAFAPPRPPAPPAPDTLPPASARFTGRAAHLAALDRAHAAATGHAGLAVVSGMGGVGKTALAVHWAHTVADRFPDGRLYFDLRGFDPVAPQTGPGPALGKALRRLGVDHASLPTDLDEQADLYRSLMAGRRVLIVLDNVHDARQVRPLLPATPGSFTIVTSRNPLTGLIGDGATAVPLNTLDQRESTAVLGRFIDADLDESRSAARIVAICSGLPLALCLVGAWAAANPGLPLSSLADRLESTSNILRVLSNDDPAYDPTTVFACSYQELGARSRTAFRLLGLHPGPDITPAALASLAALPVCDAESTLRDLATVQLVHEHKPNRFTTHDLLRAFAVQRLAAEERPDDRANATRRLLEHYLFTAAAADARTGSYRDSIPLGEPTAGVVPESLPDTTAAAAWFAAEYQVLRGLAQRTVEPAHDERIWQLAWHLSERMLLQFRGQDLAEVQAAALAAARRSGDRHREVVSLGYLAAALVCLDQEQAAAERVERALAIAEEDGRPWLQGFVLHLLGLCVAREGRDRDAVAYLRRSEAFFTQAGDERWAVRTGQWVAWHSVRAGEFAGAAERFTAVVELSRRTAAPVGEASGVMGLGFLAHHRGEYADALARFGEARAIFDVEGLPLSVCFTEELAADTREAIGEPTAANELRVKVVAGYAASGATWDADRVRRKIDPRTRASAPG